MEITCTQCGAKAPIEPETEFLRCPYCETALYLESDKSVKHFLMTPAVSGPDLGPLLQRQLS
jgi:DNA-directed RNA polymerase subunit RPC12/RpoP